MQKKKKKTNPKKPTQLTITFQADLVKPLKKQPEEHWTLAGFNESQLNNFTN